jgi:hypothetical protein
MEAEWRFTSRTNNGRGVGTGTEKALANLRRLQSMAQQAPFGRKPSATLSGGHVTPQGAMAETITQTEEGRMLTTVLGARTADGDKLEVWDGDFRALPYSTGKVTQSNTGGYRRSRTRTSDRGRASTPSTSDKPKVTNKTTTFIPLPPM